MKMKKKNKQRMGEQDVGMKQIKMKIQNNHEPNRIVIHFPYFRSIKIL